MSTDAHTHGVHADQMQFEDVDTNASLRNEAGSTVSPGQPEIYIHPSQQQVISRNASLRKAAVN